MANLNNQEFNTLESLGLLANIVQIATYISAQEIETNTDIMKALDEQNRLYLQKILVQLESINRRLDAIERGMKDV